MSIFGKIMSSLGFGDDKAADKKPTTPTPVTPPPAAAPKSADVTLSPPVPVAIGAIDVVAKLEALASANPQTLNWKVSIVDLMKLLSLDSSYSARKELATDLDCPAEKMADSAQMNMWLHKTVLQKLADNGGNIPKELLD